jgi:uncharacterized protein DUF6804
MPKKKNRNIFDHIAYLLCGVVAVVVLSSFLPGTWSYKFYVYRRSLVFVGAIYMAFLLYHKDKELLVWPFVAIALLFNPFVSINLRAEEWRFIDLLTAVIFILIK